MADSLFYNGTDADWYLRRRLIDADDVDPIKLINRFHLPEYSNELQGTKQFVFFTRPDLNLMEDLSKLNKDVNRISFMSVLWDDSRIGRNIIKSLQQRGSDFMCPYLPVLNNHCKGYAPIDDELEAVERGESLFGHKVVYAKHNFKTRSAGTISIPFKDNKDLAVYKTIKAWYDYMEHVSIGLCSPRREDIINQRLDYAVSLYFIVTKADMREIIYWEKLVGLFPVIVPNNAFTYQEGNIIEPEYTITFRYAMKDRSMNPMALSELNAVAKRSGLDGTYSPNWDVDNQIHGEPYVIAPFVEKKSGKFILRWW